MREENSCTICPRRCGVNRRKIPGFCGTGNKLRIARAAPHFWEEPCISGSGGSGTIFFSGCNMKCIYCQNYEISAELAGDEITVERLRQIYSELIFTGVHNINLVTPTHFSREILESLKTQPEVPVIYNSSGYDSVETLKRFQGKIQIYMPDLKYMKTDLSKKYSNAADYPSVATEAIQEMFRQTGRFELDEDGIMTKGVIIRHLMLPGQIENTLDVIDYVSSEFGDNVIFSLMSQFTPTQKCIECEFAELQRKVSKEEYEQALDYMYLVGLKNAYIQDFSSAAKKYTPPFDLSGVHESAMKIPVE